MTIRNFLIAVAALVQERDIISHGTIRCLYSHEASSAIEQAEGIDSDAVGTDTIGDDDLTTHLMEIAESPADVEEDALVDLMDRFLGIELSQYIECDEEDELKKLDALIEAAMEI